MPISALQIFLLGNIRVCRPDTQGHMKIPRIVKSLLAYLLLYRNRVHCREILADLFWGDQPEEKARSCLNTTIWRLRCAIEPEGVSKGTYLLTTPDGEVGFNNKSEYWLDIAAFEEKVSVLLKKHIHMMKTVEVKNLEKSLQLYRGDLLEGYYDTWALRERERLRSLYLKSLAHLTNYYEDQGAYEKSLTYGREILFEDPLREEIHRKVMRLYIKIGKRTDAVRHYYECCKILDSELNIEPMEETKALYKKIIDSSGIYLSRSKTVQSGIHGNHDKQIHLEKSSQALIGALKDLDKLRERLIKTANSIESLKKATSPK